MTREYTAYTMQFEACSIDSTTFAHVDHVGVAYEILRKYSFLDAVVIYSKCLETIATRAGAADKFNLTITLAFLSLIAERLQASDATSFDCFIEENPDLLTTRSISKWYSQERLSSPNARSVFLLPDRAA